MSIQSLDRGLTLLKLVSAKGRGGVRISDLEAQSGLSKSTIHRILDTLKAQNFVEQIPDSRRYRLGHEIPILGWSVAQELNQLREACELSVGGLAMQTGDTSFLFVRSGLESICLCRKTGTYPVKAFTVAVGARRPLGIGASGIAFLSAMDDPEAEAILDRIRPSLSEWPADVDSIVAAIMNARLTGYALSDGLTVPGVRGLAQIVRSPQGDVAATLGIAAISTRITGERVDKLAAILNQQVLTAENRLSEIAFENSTR